MCEAAGSFLRPVRRALWAFPKAGCNVHRGP